MNMTQPLVQKEIFSKFNFLFFAKVNAKKLHSPSKRRLDIFKKEKFTGVDLIQRNCIKSPDLKVAQDMGVNQRSSMCTCLIVVPFPKHLLMATVGQVSGPDGPLVSSATCYMLEIFSFIFSKPLFNLLYFPSQASICETVLTSKAFTSCNALVNVQDYIETCIQDLCHCDSSMADFCMCNTFAEYSRQCAHAGGQPLNWRTSGLCRKYLGNGLSPVLSSHIQ